MAIKSKIHNYAPYRKGGYTPLQFQRQIDKLDTKIRRLQEKLSNGY